jgi:hypothetical protein
MKGGHLTPASGRLGVESTKRAIDGLIINSGRDGHYQMLIDLRRADGRIPFNG